MRRTPTVAAIQTKNRTGTPEESFRAAEALLEQAAARGAVLAALPELSTCGYIPNDNVWQYGEPRDGPTARWACAAARRLGLCIGAGYLECEGEDFYNAYLIADASGKVTGRVRKINTEAFCFRSGESAITVDTSVGRIGIGICADNHLLSFYERMKEAEPDLVLMPHAWATPYKTSRIVRESDIEDARSYAALLPRVYAECLGVPAVFVNAVGEVPPMGGILGSLMKPEMYRLQGGSRIVNAGGGTAAAAEAEEGVIIAETEIGGMNPSGCPTDYNGWLHPGSPLVRKLILPLDIAAGRRHYKKSKVRRELALRRKNEGEA